MIGPDTWPDFLIQEIYVQRPPLSLYVFTIAGLLLACMMIWEGLFIRMFSEFKEPTALWIQAVTELDINPDGLAWPWIVLGISWIGALVGMWLKLSWGEGAAYFINILSLIYVGIGTIVAAVALLCIMLPSSRRWMIEGDG